MRAVALAAAAHPDDIEFTMSGTLVLLKQAGWDIHYLNIANGSCGSWTMDEAAIIAVRTEEARNAAGAIGAVFHPPLVNDLMIYYEDSLVRRLCALVRDINPAVLLVQSPQDYMEDHTNASRTMVTAAFCRSMPNFFTDPQRPAVDSEMAVYHAMPHGLRDQLRRPIVPDFVVDVSPVMDTKRSMLACHRSQKEWLDKTQGLDNYISTMEEQVRAVGASFSTYEFAEGWRRHLHLGFGAEDFDPLSDALSGRVQRVHSA